MKKVHSKKYLYHFLLFNFLGNKEVAALQLMVQSYTNNPKFGDAKKFQTELDSAIHHIQVLESDLHALNSQLKDVNDKLEEKSGKSPKHGAREIW